MDFIKNEAGQDLTEYALLLAFVVIASAALLLTSTDSLLGIWTATNDILATGNSLAKFGSS